LLGKGNTAEGHQRSQADVAESVEAARIAPGTEPQFRHQCLIYDGSPSRQLSSFAVVIRQMLAANYRCLYLNSPAMVAGMSSYLAAQGIDVALEISKTSLLLSSEQDHLVDGAFDVERMIAKLESAVVRAMSDGYDGLWATGDMFWEFGSERNFPKLLEYERRLEELFQKQPTLCGICQYHSDLLPREMLRQGILTHRGLFINETLSRVNPHYAASTSSLHSAQLTPKIDETIAELENLARSKQVW
jgi:hypothetical protein